MAQIQIGVAGPLTGSEAAAGEQMKIGALQAVADQRIHRDILLGTLEPHLLDGKDATWTLRALVIRGLVQLQPIGPPGIATRGRRTLGSLTDEKERHTGPDRDAAKDARWMAS